MAPNIMFLSNIKMSEIKSLENIMEDKFFKPINKTVNTKEIEYGNIPSKFTSIDSWNIDNVICWHTGILISGKRPFIPLDFKIDNEETNECRYDITPHGVFYNFNVAIDYIQNSNWSDYVKNERFNYVIELHKIFYGTEIKISPIPHPKMQKCYGSGVYTTEEYKLLLDS